MEALRDRLSGVRVVFMATQKPIDRQILERVDDDLATQSMATQSMVTQSMATQSMATHSMVAQPLRSIGRIPWHWPGILKGYWEVGRRLRARFTRDRPMVVVGTGGWASVPAVREALRAGIDVALLNPDVKPGRANRYLARRAKVVFVPSQASKRYFSPSVNVCVTGCPVRQVFRLSSDRQAGIARFGLDRAKKTLLITGASQGAQTLNRAVLWNLQRYESRQGWQILHLSGERDYQAVVKGYEGSSVRVVVLPFTHQMADAIVAADLVVCRAGASTLAEVAAVGRASVLMPYPYHRDMHQLANARELERKGAACIVLDKVEKNVNGPALGAVLEKLMADDGLRERMARSAKQIGCPGAAGAVADRLVKNAKCKMQNPEKKAVMV